MADAAWVVAAQVVRAHGVRGALRLKLHMAESLWPQHLRDVRLTGGRTRAEPRSSEVMTVESFKALGGSTEGSGEALIRLKEIPHREAALVWAGSDVALRRCDVPPPDAGDIYVYELEGAQAQDAMGHLLGYVEGVLSNPGHDLLVLQGPFGERLLPWVPSVVRHFNRQSQVLTLHVPEGLWD